MSTVSSAKTDWWKSPSATENTKTTGKNSLNDFDSFLKLLAAELQNQDPSNPVSNTEYVSQMAQISSLQQLQSMYITQIGTLQQLQSLYTSVNANNAYGMIGKKVTYATTDSTGDTVYKKGTVESVAFENSTIYLYIGGQKVELGRVVEVGEKATSGTSTT
jgi:flagellar basal-body rod modification protein FlgD